MGVSIAEAATLAKAKLQVEEDLSSPSPSFVDFSTELPFEGFAMDVADGKIGCCSSRMSTENQVGIFDADTLDEIVRFPITFPPTKFMFNKRDSAIFAASSDALRVWRHDALAGVQRVAKLQTHIHAPPVTGFDWDERIAMSSTDGHVTVFDLEKTAIISNPVVHDGPVLDVAFKPHTSCSILATAGKDGNLKITDFREPFLSTNLFKYSSPALRLRWLATESHELAFFGLDATEINVLDMRHPDRVVRRLDHLGSTPTSLDCNANFLISGCTDGQMFLFTKTSVCETPCAWLPPSPSLSGVGVHALRLLNDHTAAMLSKRLLRVFSI